MDILLHTCCAPCLVGTMLTLEDYAADIYWYNPNIHPYKEYEARILTLREYAKQNNHTLIEDGGYGLRDFLGGLYSSGEDITLGARCGYCYDLRLCAAAKYAASHGYGRFTTTLLVSPYQDRERILASGRAAGEKYGIPFAEFDFRSGFREGQAAARKAGMYMQKYCGCIFSEEERYCGL